jgi:hypothetical protein
MARATSGSLRDLDEGLITSEGLAKYGCELSQDRVRRA